MVKSFRQFEYSLLNVSSCNGSSIAAKRLYKRKAKNTPNRGQSLEATLFSTVYFIRNFNKICSLHQITQSSNFLLEWGVLLTTHIELKIVNVYNVFHIIHKDLSIKYNFVNKTRFPCQALKDPVFIMRQMH